MSWNLLYFFIVPFKSSSFSSQARILREAAERVTKKMATNASPGKAKQAAVEEAESTDGTEDKERKKEDQIVTTVAAKSPVSSIML